MTPEVKVQSAITSFLKKEMKAGKPVFYEKRQAIGYQYHKGIPDIYCILNGYHLEIEVKRPGGSRSTMQETYERILKNAGAIYACVDSFEQFKQLYDEYKEKTR